MKPTTLSYIPADDSTAGLGDDHTGATTPFTPNVATTPGDGLAHLISLTSAANLSGITFTLTGTDADGRPQTEALAGPNANTVYSTKHFKTVTSVEISATLGANTVDIGWKDEAVSRTYPLNWRQESFAVSLALFLTGTINLTVQHTFQRMSDGNPSTFRWWDHDALAAATAPADGNYAFPVTATRLKVNSLTAGATAALSIVQGG